MTPSERYRILCNIVAQKGTRDVNLHAELAKAESTLNMLNTKMSTPPPIQQEAPPMEQAPQEPQVGKYDNL